MSWFEVGIAYGTQHYMHMGSGPNNNLAEILNNQWDWSNPMETAMTFTADQAIPNWIAQGLSSIDKRFRYTPGQEIRIPLKYLLVGSYIASLLLSSLGAAIQSKRNSPRFLVAVAAPWIVFFAVMTQMHQRYLLWGATVSAGVVAVSPGFALLHLLVTAIAWSQEMQTMMMVRNYRDYAVFRFIEGWHPGVGWALLLCALIFLYVSVAPERKRVDRQRLLEVSS